MIIDFDAEQKMTLLDAMRQIPPTTHVNQDESPPWYFSIADAVYCGQLSAIRPRDDTFGFLHASAAISTKDAGCNAGPQSRY